MEVGPGPEESCLDFYPPSEVPCPTATLAFAGPSSSIITTAPTTEAGDDRNDELLVEGHGHSIEDLSEGRMRN